MKRRTSLCSYAAGASLVALALLTSGCISYHGWPDPNYPVAVRTPPPPRRDANVSSVERVTYHGWTNALRLRNRVAEVIVVPEIGRVMSFRLRSGENVFWEDRSLDGRARFCLRRS